MLIGLSLWALSTKKGKKVINHKNMIRRAYLAAIIHPHHLLFWSVWGLILMNQGVLSHQLNNIIYFCIWNVIGCFLVFMIYIFIGFSIQNFIQKYFITITRFTGIFYLVIAIRELIYI
jgi:threonine/homoserine/homoserine lactone efflux protein